MLSGPQMLCGPYCVAAMYLLLLLSRVIHLEVMTLDRSIDLSI